MFQGPWSEVPAVGLYCMEVESCLSDECPISRRVNLYPWIRWNPHVSDRVLCIQADTELCHSSVVQSLPRNISCLTVRDVGVICDIPAVSKHLTDISPEKSINLDNDNVLHKHATASHLEAADELLSVLSDAVYVRVKYQDAKCHICLLQQHAADGACNQEANNCDFSLPHCSTVSTGKLISGNRMVDIAAEFQNGCSLQCSHETGLCDVESQSNSLTVDAAVYSCCDQLCDASTQLQCSTPADTSSGQVCIISKLSVSFNTCITFEFCLTVQCFRSYTWFG